MSYGIFGGSFDPLHSEHIRLIERARESFALEKIVLLPTFKPHHKHNAHITPYEERLAMLKLYADQKDFLLIDESEKELGLEASYFYKSLDRLKARYGSDVLYLIGGDSAVTFPYWKNCRYIAENIKIAVISREGYDDTEAVERIKREYGADITLTDLGCREVSSTALRAMLETGDKEVNRYLLPPIAEYISEKGLYRNYPQLIEKLKSSVSEELFGHLRGTALFALKYSTALDISYEKAFLASMLHDCAKEMHPLNDSYPTKSPSVIHQYDGAELAEKAYKIKDEEILDAIRYHTTGRPDMTALGKLVFVADKLEAGRRYPGVDRLRDITAENFEEGFLAVLQSGFDCLKSKSAPIDVLTSATLAWYNVDK